jgi:ABC-type Fe3+ transport system permease subunit
MKLIFNLAIVFIFWAASTSLIDRLKKNISENGKMDLHKEERILNILSIVQIFITFLFIPFAWFGIYICFNDNWGWKDLFNPEVWGTIGYSFIFAIPTFIIFIIFEAIKKKK